MQDKAGVIHQGSSKTQAFMLGTISSIIILSALLSNSIEIDASLELELEPNDFSLSINPPSTSITAGQSAQSTVTVNLVSGSVPSVSLLCSVSPPSDGIDCGVTPSTVNPTGDARILVSTQEDIEPGQYTASITNAGPVKKDPVTFDVEVRSIEPPPPPPPDIWIIIAGAAIAGGLIIFAAIIIKRRRNNKGQSNKGESYIP